MPLSSWLYSLAKLARDEDSDRPCSACAILIVSRYPAGSMPNFHLRIAASKAQFCASSRWLLQSSVFRYFLMAL